MSKRRVFDIDFPDEEPTDTPAPETRRGPMAAAINENAEALKDRQVIEADIREENDRLAHEHVRLKKAGLITDLIPLDAVLTDKLTRDRKSGRDADLDELKASIRDVGLSNPIRVEAIGEGQFELIQGYRRLMAFRELFQETGDDDFALIPAGITAEGAELELLYRRMVDENLVRRDISFGEMATLVLAFVKDLGTPVSDVDEALISLFGSASRQKRSYIKHFITVIEALGGHLNFPEAIPRALGLKLEKSISGDESSRARIRGALAGEMATTVEAELAVLKKALEPVRASKPAKTVGQGPRAAKTTFRQRVTGGMVRCTASEGRVEMRLDRDFSNVDRHRLEAAIQAFFGALDDD